MKRYMYLLGILLLFIVGCSNTPPNLTNVTEITPTPTVTPTIQPTPMQVPTPVVNLTNTTIVNTTVINTNITTLPQNNTIVNMSASARNASSAYLAWLNSLRNKTKNITG